MTGHWVGDRCPGGHADQLPPAAEPPPARVPASTGRFAEPAAMTCEFPACVSRDRVIGGVVHMPWVEVSLTPCPGGPWLAAPDGPALVCRHKHYHPKAGPAAGNTTADLRRPA